MEKQENKQANEEISKFKLLSAYGGPGSIVHTAYGSILISCIEEWGFIQRLNELRDNALKLQKGEVDYVKEQADLEELYLSNDERLLNELISVKKLTNLKFLALLPNIELVEAFNIIRKGKTGLAINSSYMPKGFLDRYNHYKKYNEWFDIWKRKGQNEKDFSPPKYFTSEKDIKNDGKYNSKERALKQDNIVLICQNGHISDFPWSKYLRWRTDFPDAIYECIDLLSMQNCCDKPDIQINETLANASGFDGKWLKCNTKGCQYCKGVSLKGLMSTKVTCKGHKPWEAETGSSQSYFGNIRARTSEPPSETCRQADPMRVALTTGNNLYFSRILSSLYMPPLLFMDEVSFQIRLIEQQMRDANKEDDFVKCVEFVKL